MALAKAEGVVDMIGFPEFILDPVRLDAYYADLHVSNETFFDNVVSASRTENKRDLQRLRKPVDKNKWDMTPPEVPFGICQSFVACLHFLRV